MNKRLLTGIIETIQRRHFDALRMINHGMVTLFWDIGDIVKKVFETQDANLNLTGTSEKISSIFLPQFGRFFSIDNILLMESFANRCSSATLNQIASAISWKHIPMFLNLESQDAWIFYARLIHQESLSPEKLSQKISKNLFDKNGLILEYPEHPFFGVFSIKSPYEDIMGIKKYFEEPEATTFRLLFEPKDEDLDKLNISVFNEELIKQIYKKIFNFQVTYNHWLNVYINHAFREVGELITNSLNISDPTTEPLLGKIAKHLEQQYGSLFNEEQIYLFIKFAQQFKDPLLTAEISQTVRWEHIKILLRIDDRDAQIFYAHQVLENGFSAGDLEKIIFSNSYESKLHNRDQENGTAVSKPITEQKVKSGNKNIINTTVAIEEIINPKHDLNRNIFKNPDLLQFLKVI